MVLSRMEFQKQKLSGEGLDGIYSLENNGWKKNREKLTKEKEIENIEPKKWCHHHPHPQLCRSTINIMCTTLL